MTCGKKHCQNAPTEATKVDHTEVEGRPLCDHPGCDKRVVGDGTRCADGHVQGAAAATPSTEPLNGLWQMRLQAGSCPECGSLLRGDGSCRACHYRVTDADVRALVAGKEEAAGRPHQQPGAALSPNLPPPPTKAFGAEGLALTPEQEATLTALRERGLTLLAKSIAGKWRSGQTWYVDARVSVPRDLRAAVKRGNRAAQLQQALSPFRSSSEEWAQMSGAVMVTVEEAQQASRRLCAQVQEFVQTPLSFAPDAAADRRTAFIAAHAQLRLAMTLARFVNEREPRDIGLLSQVLTLEQELLAVWRRKRVTSAARTALFVSAMEALARGDAAAAQGQPALYDYAQAEAACALVNNVEGRSLVARVYVQMGHYALQSSNPNASTSEARDRFGQAYELADSELDPVGQAAAFEGYAQVHWARDEHPDAVQKLRDAVEYAHTGGDVEQYVALTQKLANAEQTVSRLARDKGLRASGLSPEKAIAELRQALQLAHCGSDASLAGALSAQLDAVLRMAPPPSEA